MDASKPTIEFRLNDRSAVPVYMQIVQQVRQALRLGFLVVGDRLPTVREVVSKIAINPNTVFKAYRELEMERLIESHQGLGTFVIRSLADESIIHLDTLRAKLAEWIRECRLLGLNDESIEALFSSVFQEFELETQNGTSD